MIRSSRTCEVKGHQRRIRLRPTSFFAIHDELRMDVGMRELEQELDASIKRDPTFILNGGIAL